MSPLIIGEMSARINVAPQIDPCKVHPSRSTDPLPLVPKEISTNDHPKVNEHSDCIRTVPGIIGILPLPIPTGSAVRTKPLRLKTPEERWEICPRNSVPISSYRKQKRQDFECSGASKSISRSSRSIPQRFLYIRTYRTGKTSSETTPSLNPSRLGLHLISNRQTYG